ncbi:hypothetical protein JCGZ_23691 [Jatropha curcas]|uniref:Uncharacterized protein n=1 Tax=Jatropha curcas TaxID=180498 RepID=A0A067L2T1_JATCU|nr:hypothetical protein JCGZ_23691 [Jatropha curcas]
MQDKSRTREDVLSKHRQFIRAIRGQIEHVEKSMDGPSIRDSLKHSKLVNLNEQDRDGLALFLTGGWNTKHLNHHDMEDNSILRRFLDPTLASSFKDDEIVEHGNIELEKLKMNGDMHANSLKMNRDMHAHHHSLKDGYQRNLGSHYTTTADSDP